VTVIC